MKKLLFWEGITTVIALVVFFATFSLLGGWSFDNSSDVAAIAAMAAVAGVVVASIFVAYLGIGTGTIISNCAGLGAVIVIIISVALDIRLGIIAGSVGVLAAILAKIETIKRDKIKPGWLLTSLITEAAIIFLAMTIPTGLLF